MFKFYMEKKMFFQFFLLKINHYELIIKNSKYAMH
jgi:hypothetical protein